MHLAARDGKDAKVNIIIFETVLAYERHSNRSTRTVYLLVTIPLSRLTVLFVHREVGGELDFGASETDSSGRCRSLSRTSDIRTFATVPSSSDVLAISEAEMHLTWRQHVLGDYLEEHVGVWNDIDDLCLFGFENLVAVLISNEAPKLIPQLV